MEGGQQREIDFQRGEQLALLRDVQFEKNGIARPGTMKTVLNTIDQYGRGRSAFPSVATIARSANVSRRTVFRAIEVLERLGLICVSSDGRHGRLGSPTNRYTIVWTELRVLVDRQKQSASGADQSASGADQSASGADQSASGARPGCQSGTQIVFEAPLKRRLSVHARADETGRDGAREAWEEAGDTFTEDELAAVREKANTIDRWIAAKLPTDRELVLKIATLWHDGELPEDAVQQVLESFQRKREARQAIDRPCGWLWATLRDKVSQHGVRLEALLARTRWPAELLAPRVATTP